MKLAVVPLDQIDFGLRRREELGDVQGLAESIKERGLIHPIAVVEMGFAPSEVVSDPNKNYLLLAGGRRYTAYREVLEETEIPCRIFDEAITEHKLRAIELSENVDRKDLEWKERLLLEKEVHDLMLAEHGVKISQQGADSGGWSIADTARMMGKDRSSVSKDLQTAAAVEAYPELFEKCTNKNEANKLLKVLEEKAIKAELAKRAEQEFASSRTQKRLADNFILQDFFSGVAKVPDNSVDFIDCDPPYAINIRELQQVKSSSHLHDDSFDDKPMSPQQYRQFTRRICTECFRVLKPDRWMIMWYAPEPWAELVYEELIKAGFRTSRLVARWTKGSGQNMNPQYNLTRTEDTFYYARKGTPQLTKPGRSNEFTFNRPHHTDRRHPTEKPVDLMTEILETFCLPGMRVMVPFLGSGNTMLAATEAKMEAFGFEAEKTFRDSFLVKVSELGGKR